MAEYRLRPGDRWPNETSATLILADGEYDPDDIPDLTADGMTIRAEHPRKARIRGGRNVGEGADKTCALRAKGAHKLTLEGLVVSNPKGRGVRVTDSNNVTVRNCYFTRNRVEGLQTGKCHDLLVEACWFEGSGYNGDQVTGDDRSHGCYASYGGQRPVIRRCTFYRTRGSGVQFNSTKEDGQATIEGAVIEECVFQECGHGGTGAIAAISIAGFRFQRLQFTNHGDSGLATFFATVAAHPCSDGVMTDYSIEGDDGWGIRPNNVRNVRISEGSGWDPTPPDPEPPPEDEHAQCRADLAAMTAERDALLAWQAAAREVVCP